jgi:hypothetical protein
MAKRTSGIIDSVDSLRRRMPRIVAAVNEDPGLAERAAANPILALEELGYVLSDRFRPEAELRARFAAPEAKRVVALRSEVEEHLRAGVDLTSAESIVRALRSIDVQLPETARSTAVETDLAAQPETNAPVRSGEAKQGRGRHTDRRRRTRAIPTVPPRPIPEDAAVALVPALREAEGKHAVIRPLADYLELEASRPRLATERVYARLRERPPDPARTDVAIRFRLQREQGED